MNKFISLLCLLTALDFLCLIFTRGSIQKRLFSFYLPHEPLESAVSNFKQIRETITEKVSVSLFFIPEISLKSPQSLDGVTTQNPPLKAELLHHTDTLAPTSQQHIYRAYPL